MKKALKFDPHDNVAVALDPMKSGDHILINGEESSVVVTGDLPQGHKIAVKDIAAGETIYKYGHPIGTAA